MAKQSKRNMIVKAKEKFLKTSDLSDIHIGDFCFFEDIALWGIQPLRLLVDLLDELIEDNKRNPAHIIANDIRKKLDELIEQCDKWTDEQMAAEQKIEQGKNLSYH